MSKMDVNNFVVWRFASQRGWAVSYEEIADATGLSVSQVGNAIQRKGWGGRIGKGRNKDNGVGQSYYQFKRGANADINRLDLTLLMAGGILPPGLEEQ